MCSWCAAFSYSKYPLGKLGAINMLGAELDAPGSAITCSYTNGSWILVISCIPHHFDGVRLGRQALGEDCGHPAMQSTALEEWGDVADDHLM